MKTSKSKSYLSQFWRQIVIVVVAIVAIVYFYPHPDNSLPEFSVGKPWQYETLRADFEMPKTRDKAKVQHDLDSLNKVFVRVYRRDAPKNIEKSISKNVLAQLEAAKLLDTIIDVVSYKKFCDDVSGKIVDYYSSKGGNNGLVLDGSKDNLPDLIRTKEEKNVLKTYITTAEIKEELYGIETALKAKNKLLDAAKLDQLLVATAVYDAVASDSLLQIESLPFTGDLGKFQVGETIIEKGHPVSAQDSVYIRTYFDQKALKGADSSSNTVLEWFGEALFVLLTMGMLVAYLLIYEQQVWNSPRDVGFVVGMITVMFVIAVIISSMLKLGLYLVPIAIVPILLLVFFNGRLALWGGIILALLCSGISTSAFQYIFLQIVACATAVISLRELTQRSQLLKTSALVLIGLVLAYLAVQLMTTGSLNSVNLRMLGTLTAYAVLTSLTYVLMFGIERLFGYVSNVTLVELSDVNSPLLRKLSDECPGTFQHVVAVSNLASDAAGRIGANALLTRAGAMYHDIGKLSNPMFFTENQHGVNPHDGLSPLRSAEIIISHVTDGLRRAEKAGLPHVLRDFISQHHGAGQAKYFYFTYCKQHPDEQVDPAPFTYPGPNPQTRESSVLMMADAVEAASRSLKEHTPKAISDLVNKIIDGQIADGLHSDSPLSFHDIKTIKEAFVRRLMTMYHSRISYPDDPNKTKIQQK